MAGIWRRSRGNPFRFVDRISDLRQEFSFSARRISMAAFAELMAIHWFACILWWTIRLQDYPRGEPAACIFEHLLNRLDGVVLSVSVSEYLMFMCKHL